MFEWSFKDGIGEFIAGAGATRRQVTHVLENSVEDEAGLLSQLVLVHQLFQQRQLDGFSGVPPQFFTPAFAGRAQGQALGHGPLGRGPEVVDGVLLQRVRLLHRIQSIGLGWKESPTMFRWIHGKEGLQCN